MRRNGESSRDYFDWVVVLNLKRRPDRLRRFEESLAEIEWPFKKPEVFPATDGHAETPPKSFLSGPGAWGCLRSHIRILEEALHRGFESVLVLEDDVCFVPDFAEQALNFLSRVPYDWDQLMLGGQHTLEFNGAPVEETTGVLRCRDCERTHCYAVQGAFMSALLERWRGGGMFNATVHCDWIMGRDPDMQMAHKVYAPAKFVAGQELNHSDIVQTVVPRQFWNPPDPELPVLLLRSPASVAEALRPYGIYTGRERDPFTAIEKELAGIYHIRSQGQTAHEIRLAKWIERRQWEVCSDPHLICTIWHPNAAEDEIRRTSPYPVYTLEAETVDDALHRMPEALRRDYRPLNEQEIIIHLRSDNKRVLMEARPHGWHNGFRIDPDSQLNSDLILLCKNKRERWRRTGTLRKLVSSLMREASTIPGGVPVIWHPEIDSDHLREATDKTVVEIEANDSREALEKWHLHRDAGKTNNHCCPA